MDITTDTSASQEKLEVHPHTWTHNGERVLMVKTVDKDLRSHNSFQWPERGTVKAPDAKDNTQCGGGLHGWPWGLGLGDGKELCVPGERWIVFSAKPENVRGYLENGWKCKAIGECEVVHVGTMATAIAMVRDGQVALIQAMAVREEINGAAKTINAASGDSSQLAASGDSSKLAASGDSSQLAASGYYSQLAASGYYSQLAASGDYSQLAASGYYSKLAASGDYSICMAFKGRCLVGEKGVFAIAYLRSDKTPDIVVGRVGENGIKPHTWYEVVDGKLSEAEGGAA